MRIKSRTAIILCLALLLFTYEFQVPTATAQDNVYYVDVNNPEAQDDQDHGNIDQPWQSLDYAFNQLQPGDTLLIRGGVYQNDEIVLTAQNSGQSNAPITVQAFPGETVTINQGQMFEFDGASWWVIDGLVFQNFEQDQIIQLGRENRNAENIVIRNCIFRNSKGGPIKIAYAKDILIENNTFTGINTQKKNVGVSAIELLRLVKRVTIRNNLFYDNATDGIHMGATANPIIEDVLIENNEFALTTDQVEWGENGVTIKTVDGPVTVTKNYFHGFRPTYNNTIGHKGGTLGEALIALQGAHNVHIEGNYFEDNTVHLTISDQQNEGYRATRNIMVVNNVFNGSPYYSGNQYRPSGEGVGIKVNRATENIVIVHNTIIDSQYYLLSRQMNAVFKNNAIYRGGGERVLDGSNWSANHNAWYQKKRNIPETLQGDQDLYEVRNMLLDDEFRPLPGSPLLNHGASLGITVDYEGNPRNDGHPDLGAFEFGGGVTITPIAHAIDPGQTAEFVIQFLGAGADAEPMDLIIGNSSTDLVVTTTSNKLNFNEPTYVTVADRHPLDTILKPGIWYTIPISITGTDFSEEVELRVLVGGSRVYLPGIFNSAE